MATIGHTFTERNTDVTNATSTFAAVTDIAQASGNFTAGKKYLLIATAQAGQSTADEIEVQLLHGSTVFEGSLGRFVMPTAGNRHTWQYMTVWTAVSSEGLDMQLRRGAAAGGTASVNKASLLSINLTDSFTENTDWIFAESTADQALTGTFSDGASITFTPATASRDWLVLSYANCSYSSTVNAARTRVNSTAGSTVLPQALWCPNGSGSLATMAMARVFNLPASSTTIKEEADAASSNATRLYSAIFAIDLGEFSTYGQAYTEGDFTYTATAIATPDELQTCSITPTTASDVWVLGYHGFDKTVATYTSQYRVQVDNSDQPSGQTTDAYVFNAGHITNSVGDEVPTMLSTMVASMTAAAHTIDMDGAVSNTTSSPSAQQRQLVAIQLSTPDGGSPPPSAVTWVGYIG